MYPVRVRKVATLPSTAGRRASQRKSITEAPAPASASARYCPWCGANDPVAPEPAAPEPEDEPEHAVVLDDPPAGVRPLEQPQRSSEDRLHELVVCLMVLMVSSVLAAVGFFLARYLSL